LRAGHARILQTDQLVCQDALGAVRQNRTLRTLGRLARRARVACCAQGTQPGAPFQAPSALVMRSLAKSPAARPATAAMLLEQLAEMQ
jgi:hypothetical protein